MTRFFTILAFAFLLFSCQEVDNTVISEDADLIALQDLFLDQSNKLVGTEVSKSVTTNGETISKNFVLDSTFFKADLAHLSNPQIPKKFGPGSYEKNQKGLVITYQRRDGQRNGPTLLSITQSANGSISEVEITEKNNNVLFSSGSVSHFRFEGQALKEYRIIGIQKIIGLDSSIYEVTGKILIN